MLRDGAVRDLRGLQTILADQATAFRDRDQGLLDRALARGNDAALPADIGIARLKLAECVVADSSIPSLPRETSRS